MTAVVLVVVLVVVDRSRALISLLLRTLLLLGRKILLRDFRDGWLRTRIVKVLLIE
jgi:hypothetical protein